MSECGISCAVASIIRGICDRRAGLDTPSRRHSPVVGCSTSGHDCCDHADTVDDIADIIGGLDRILVLMDGHDTLVNLLTSRLHKDSGNDSSRCCEISFCNNCSLAFTFQARTAPSRHLQWYHHAITMQWLILSAICRLPLCDGDGHFSMRCIFCKGCGRKTATKWVYDSLRY